MRLNFDRIEERSQKKTPGLYKLFLENSLELKKIPEIFRWNFQDFSYFFLENSDVLRRAKPAQIEYLTRLYPEFPIKSMLQQPNNRFGHGETRNRKCA